MQCYHVVNSKIDIFLDYLSYPMLVFLVLLGITQELLIQKVICHHLIRCLRNDMNVHPIPFD